MAAGEGVGSARPASLTRKPLTLLETAATCPSPCLNTNVMGGGALRSKRITEMLVAPC